MSKFYASSWEVISEDNTGSIVHVKFCCPECGFDTSVLIYTTETNLTDWETDQQCPVCDEPITIVCCLEDKE